MSTINYCTPLVSLLLGPLFYPDTLYAYRYFFLDILALKYALSRNKCVCSGYWAILWYLSSHVSAHCFYILTLSYLLCHICWLFIYLPCARSSDTENMYQRKCYLIFASVNFCYLFKYFGLFLFICFIITILI